MRSIIILAVFVILIGILFFSLFKQPIHGNSTQIRFKMRTDEIERRQNDFFKRQIKRCRKDLFAEAVEFVDSLIMDINPKNELDSLTRRFRPKAQIEPRTPTTEVKLEPLFSEIDTLE